MKELTVKERIRRNLNPHREARLAMIVWGSEYSHFGGGSMDFWDSLEPHFKRLVKRWCTELENTKRVK